MRPRPLALLAVVTLATAAVAGWSWYDHRSADTVDAGGDAMFPVLSAGNTSLDRIDITAPAYKLGLVYRDGAWVAEDHGDFPIDTKAAAQLVSDFAGLQIWEAKTAQPDWYGRIGVEDAEDGSKSSRVRFADASGAPLADAIVGERSSLLAGFPRGGTFVRVPGDPQAWLVQGTVTLPATIGEWIGTVMQIPGPTVQRVAILEGDRPVLEIERDGDVYKLAEADAAVVGPDAVINDSAVKGMIRGIVSVRPTDVAPIGTVSFPDAGRSVVYTTDSGMTLTARVGEIGDATWIAFNAAGEGAAAEQAAAINARTSSWAFLLEPRSADTFKTTVEALTAPEVEPTPAAGIPGMQGIPGMPAMPGGAMPMPPMMPAGAVPVR